MKKNRDFISILISFLVFVLMYSVTFIEYTEVTLEKAKTDKTETLEKVSQTYIVGSTVQPSKEVQQKQ